MKIAIIVIHYGQLSTTRNCLLAIKQKITSHRLILINNTHEDIADLAKIIPETTLINNKTNFGFAKAVNQGISLASADPAIGAFLLMNNDLSFSFGSLDLLTKTFLTKPSCGIVSPILHHHQNLYDWGGKFNKWFGMVKHRNFEQRPKTILTVNHVAGAAMLIKREVVDKIGLFDERFFLYFEDLDYCLRAIKAGFTVHINPEVVAEHTISSSSNALSRTLNQWRSHIVFVAKYLPRTVYPTSLLTDIFFYPLITFKSLLFK